MSFGFDRLLDSIGRTLLRVLQESARVSWRELGGTVALSAPAVAERVRKMEEAGIIDGYHARVDPTRAGLPVTAFILLKTTAQHYPALTAFVGRAPEVSECHHVSGEHSFLIKVHVSGLPHLESLIDRLGPFGDTHSLIVLSSPVVKHALDLEGLVGCSAMEG